MSKFPPMPYDLFIILCGRPVDIGSPFGKIDNHHCILTKGDMRGMPDSEKAKIHRPWNILRVNHEWHLNKPVPEHVEAALIMYRLYDREVIRHWLKEEIQWRQGPPFELP